MPPVASQLSSHQMAIRSQWGVFHRSLLLQHFGIFGPTGRARHSVGAPATRPRFIIVGGFRAPAVDSAASRVFVSPDFGLLSFRAVFLSKYFGYASASSTRCTARRVDARRR